MNKKNELQANVFIIILTVLAVVLLMSSCAPGCYSGFCNTYSQVEQSENINCLN
mgnify:FL=1